MCLALTVSRHDFDFWVTRLGFSLKNDFRDKSDHDEILFL